MPRPKEITLTVQVDRDGICAAQTTAGAGDLTINGALASGGSYAHGTAQQIGIYSAADLSALTFTVNGTGYDSNGRYSASLSEDVAGPNATTVETTDYFLTVSSVSVDGAAGTNVEVGPVDEAVSQPIPLNWRSEFNAGLNVVQSAGTINSKVQHTFNKIQTDTAITWNDHDNLTNLTSTADGNYAAPVVAARLVVNSASSGDTSKIQVVQS